MVEAYTAVEEIIDLQIPTKVQLRHGLLLLLNNLETSTGLQVIQK